MMMATRPREVPTVDAILKKHHGRRRRGPDSERRAAHGYTLTVVGEHLSGKRSTARLSGVDPYGLTAQLMGMAARALDASSPGGVLAPSELLPRGSLSELEALGNRLSVQRAGAA